jgi:hypothetical protein
MSLKDNKNVAYLAEKYTRDLPNVERDLIRRLIRVENPDFFSEQQNSSYLSNLRKLDRKLETIFSKKQHDVAAGSMVNVMVRNALAILNGDLGKAKLELYRPFAGKDEIGKSRIP